MGEGQRKRMGNALVETYHYLKDMAQSCICQNVLTGKPDEIKHIGKECILELVTLDSLSIAVISV